MRDAAVREADTAQAGEELVRALAHMQQHGQAGALGELELLDVNLLLEGRVQARHEEIQADLAHRHQARVVAVRPQRLAQGLQVGVVGTVHVQRVDAQRIGQAVAVRQRAHGVEVRALDRRQHLH